MKENDFYKMLEICEAFNPEDPTNGYYPTVAEFEAHDIQNCVEKYAPMLAYFASDPYKGTEISKEEDYIACVRYCKKALSEIFLD